MPPLTDEQFFDSINKSPTLGDATKRMYISRIKQMREIFDTPIRDILRKSEYYSKRINTIWKNPRTAKGYFVVLLSLFRHNPEFKEEYEGDYQRYTSFSKDHHDEIESEVNMNKPTDKQAVGYVPFHEIKAQVDKLPKGLLPRLLLAVYTMIPPARADYNRVAIYRNTIPEKPEPNYILINSKGMRLHLSEYKTAKSMGALDEMLPKDLVKEIEASLKYIPRDWLFVGNDGEPMSSNAYIKFANRWFKKIFGKPLTIGIVRHSFINTIDFNTTSIEERMRVAKYMGHSYITQGKYKWIGMDSKEKEDE